MSIPGLPAGEWQQIQTVATRQYQCGYCSHNVGSEKGWTTSGGHGHIRVCPLCKRPTFFVADYQDPGPIPGESVGHLPPGVSSLYTEARQAIAANACTAAVLALRKLLMHIAVDCGATAGDSFASYVRYLEDHHYVPPRATAWVDKIRKRGNEANHEIVLMGKADAVELLTFTQMLLRLVYEYPAIGAAAPPGAPAQP